MIATLGYYILFLFNVVLTAFLSMIIYYLNNKDNKDDALSFFSTLSIIIVSLVTVSNNYTSLKDETTIILPIMIISLFIFLGLFIHKKINTNQEFMNYMLFIFMPILIGMGFYVSTVSAIAVIFSMKYFLNGVFNFFTNHKEDLLDDESNIIDLEDQDSQTLDLKDEDDIIGLDK